MGIWCGPEIIKWPKTADLPTTVLVALIPNKIKSHHKNISTSIITTSQNHILHSEHMPTDFPEASGPRKRKLSSKVTTNGDPEVERKRKRLEAIKQSTKPALTTQAPAKTKPATKPAPRPQRPSVETEESDEESDHHTSVPPHNPQRVLEATNGSDNDDEAPVPDGNKEDLEVPEESDEAELSM
jgi:hypothetical protein